MMVKKIKFFAVAIMAAVVMLSCDKEEEVTPPNPLNGNYSGTCEFVNTSNYTLWNSTFTATVDESKIYINIEDFISVEGSIGLLSEGFFAFSETINNVEYNFTGTVRESGSFSATLISNTTTGSLSGNKD